MRNLKMKNIKSYHSLSLAKANASRDIQINFNQAEDALTIPAEARHDYKCGSTTQRGRSMIEMLGVLAIIGVLSVGGIAGYSKAMMKYRINKTIEQITLISGNVRSFFALQKNYEGLSHTNVIKKAKLVPDEMWEGDSIKNVFGGIFELGYFSVSEAQGYVMEIHNIPQEACIELATQDWSSSIGLIAMLVGDGDVSVTDDCINGDYWEDDNVGCIYNHTIPLTIDKAVNACADDTFLSFYFR